MHTVTKLPWRWSHQINKQGTIFYLETNDVWGSLIPAYPGTYLLAGFINPSHHTGQPDTNDTPLVELHDNYLAIE